MTVELLELEEKDMMYSAMPLPIFSDVITTVLAIYLAFIVISFSLVPNRGLNRSSDVFLYFRQKLNFLSGRIMSDRGVVYLGVALLIFFVCNAIHLSSIDIDLLLSNNYYLLIKEPDLIGLDSSAGRVYHLAFRYLGFIFFSIGFIALNRGRFILAAMIFLVSLYPFIFLLAGNSRWAPMYFSVGIILFFIERKYITLAVMIVLMYMCMDKVLIGREMYYHGLNHLFDHFYVERTYGVVASLLFMCLNVFEGAMNLGNTLLNDPKFDQRYINLSFSPFFSFMDGFDLIRDDLKHKWAPNVPMSSVSESYQFGLVYFTLFLALYFYLMRKINVMAVKKLTAPFLVVFILFIYVSLGIHTYSIRTFWKLMIFMLIFIYVSEKKNA
ncbi:MAG: hypothetical protein KKF22_02865 [Gammaproteobacteria bacterium]|nr:hypothetical protein [Gammaproteobacteria bacterium]